MDRSFVDSRDRERGEGLKRCVRRDVRLEQCFSRGPARLVRRTDSCEKVIKRGRCIQRRLEQRNGYIPLLFTFETKESLFSLSLSLSLSLFLFFCSLCNRWQTQNRVSTYSTVTWHNKSGFRAVFTRRAFIQQKATRGNGSFFVEIHRLSGLFCSSLTQRTFNYFKDSAIPHFYQNGSSPFAD